MKDFKHITGKLINHIPDTREKKNIHGNEDIFGGREIKH